MATWPDPRIPSLFCPRAGLAAQKQKLADLEASYEKSKAETGENSEETKNCDAREQAG